MPDNFNLNFKSDEQFEENGLIWKPILREGNWRFRPPSQGGVKKELNIIPGKASDISKEIGLEDLVDSFKAKAWDHVTIPKNHFNKVDENTGYIRDLKISDDPTKPGRKVLMAAHEFTEPDIKDKVLRGSIANNSCGIEMGYVDKESGKVYPSVLKHSCLTNEPFIHGLAAFDEKDKEDEVFFDEVQPEEKVDLSEVINEAIDKQSETIFDKVKELLTKKEETRYNNSNQPVVEELTEATNGGFANMPIELKDLNLSEEDSTKLASYLADQEASIKADAETAAKTEAEVALSEAREEKERLEAELATHREAERTSEVDNYIGELKELGFEDSPGFLVAVRNVLLADTGENTINFSEDGKETSLDVTGVVKTLVASLPTKDGKIDLSEQANLIPGDEKPENDTTRENQSVEERAAAARKELGIPVL